jgi:putative DNA primase/helicase
MNEHPDLLSQKEQHEVTTLPAFDLASLNLGLEEIKQEAAELAEPENKTVQAIFNQLLEQLEPVDFQEAAFPGSAEIKKRLSSLEPDSKEAEVLKAELNKKKVTEKIKHIVTVDQVTKAAERNKWGLCKNLAFVYLYNGAYWVNLEPDLLKKFLGDAAEKIGYGITASHYSDKRNLFEQFLSYNFLPTPERPKDVVQINLKNGTFEITPQGRTLKPHSPKDFLTYVLPFGYDQEAACLKFEKFLNRVLPDQERQQLLAEFFAYVFLRTSTLKLEKVLILQGTGANGKSVVFEISRALFGEENVCSYSLKSLCDDSGQYRARLQNKLLNYASEIDKGINPDIVKKLASGEPCEARLLYHEPFLITDYAKLFFNANELPKDVEHTEAFFRRLSIIGFDVTIPEAEQDKELSRKIIESELPGILNWVLKGLDRLLQNKNFSECEAVKKKIDSYRKDSNSVLLFMEEAGYSASKTESLPVPDIYREYKAFCMEGGFNPMNKTNFKKQLSNMGILFQEKGGRTLFAYLQKENQL